MPLFSIITPTYQCVEKLSATAESVLAQPGDLFEYLLIDGGSTDGTRELIESFRHSSTNLRTISEPDKGVYDAMNKGIELASGRFIYFLGAGDQLQHGALEAVATEIAKLPTPSKAARPTLLYGNVIWARYKRPYNGRYNRYKLLYRNICHQAIFHERSIFERIGRYNTKYCVRADLDFNIRCFNDSGITKRYLPHVIAVYEGGGMSDTVDDPAFNQDFPSLVRQYYGVGVAALMRVTTPLAHPRELFYYKPRRFIRRTFCAHTKA